MEPEVDEAAELCVRRAQIHPGGDPGAPRLHPAPHRPSSKPEPKSLREQSLSGAGAGREGSSVPRAAS